MFTGLIADLGRVSALERDESGATLTVSTALAEELGEGDSVAVNGVCLTAVALAPESFRAQAMIETLERSSLGALSVGSRVNLELPLRAGIASAGTSSRATSTAREPCGVCARRGSRACSTSSCPRAWSGTWRRRGPWRSTGSA